MKLLTTIAKGTRAAINLKNAKMVTPRDDLVEAYNWLKSSDRNASMGALSEYNPRVLILTPGYYDLSSGLVLDTDDVHIYHFGPPEACVVDYTGVSSGTDKDVHTYTIQQTCYRLTLHGFTIYQSTGSVMCSSFVINSSVGVNIYSNYINMRFRRASINTASAINRLPLFLQTQEQGFWRDCIADAAAWRVAEDVNFNPTMWNCISEGNYAFGGDNNASATGTGTIGGEFYNCKSEKYAFGGCTGYGMPISSAAEFYHCVADENSYGLGMLVEGKFYNCKGGRGCFGGYTVAFDSAYPPVFAGEAYNCIAGPNSFGSGVRSTSTQPKFTGKLIGCVMEGEGGYGETMQCEGGHIENCRLKMGASNQDCILITDGNTVILNSTLISTGTGNSIDAASALNVVAAHCRMNTALGGNVTNLVSTPYNVVDANVA